MNAFEGWIDLRFVGNLMMNGILVENFHKRSFLKAFHEGNFAKVFLRQKLPESFTHEKVWESFSGVESVNLKIFLN
jgi:hypothetical protein